MDERLPLTATTGQLVARIVEVQQRVRVRKADAVALAALVMDQLDRARSCANVLEVPLEAIEPRGQFWLPTNETALHDVTLVDINGYGRSRGIVVRRAGPSSHNGELTLVLKPALGEVTRG